MTDREEREKVIEILQKEKKTALHDNRWAFDYAIASIKTDIKYDLLYEETSGQADKQADKPITKNCESCRYYGSHHKVCNYCYKCSLWTEQEPTKNDLAVDCVARQDIERYIEGFINEYTPKEELEFINLELDGLKHIPTVTPQEPILDKITEIIEPLRHLPIGEMSDIEWDILRVIDKYKAEVRDNNG